MAPRKIGGEMRLPISVKGVVIQRGRVLVLRNERDEWELPGGRLDEGETPEEALVREIQEETGLSASVSCLVDAWVFQVTPKEKVLILQYACRPHGKRGVTISHEHNEHAWLRLADMRHEPLPDGYLRGIQRAAWLLRRRLSRPWSGFSRPNCTGWNPASLSRRSNATSNVSRPISPSS